MVTPLPKIMRSSLVLVHSFFLSLSLSLCVCVYVCVCVCMCVCDDGSYCIFFNVDFSLGYIRGNL